MLKFLLLTIVLFHFKAHALETDNYLVWGVELEDSTPIINTYLNDEIEELLLKSKSESCSDITADIFSTFKSYLVHHNPVENYVLGHASEKQIFPRDIYYVDRSIYQDPFRFYIPAFGLSPNIQVEGVYFGTDKLSHFASTGMEYLIRYQRSLENGSDEKKAIESAVMFGVRDEKSLHGHWASGVYSYADLEANFQGFLFYKELCSKYITQMTDGKWILKHKVDIRKYVNPHWDESYNLSYRLPENWKKVASILKRDYCSKAENPEVQKRFDYYKTLDQGNYLHFRFLDLNQPKPQSFTQLCRSALIFNKL